MINGMINDIFDGALGIIIILCIPCIIGIIFFIRAIVDKRI